MPPKRKMKTSILNPKIDIIGKEKGIYKFTLSNTNLSIANAIRRVILSEIPVFGFKETYNKKKMINIKENTSQFNNQILIQRLGCIPVHIDDIEKNVDNLLIELNVENTSDELMYVTTNDFTIKQLLEDDNIGGELSKKNVEKIFPCDSITKDYILFTRLKPKITQDILGEKIHLTAKLSKYTAYEDGRFNVVSICAYGYTPDPVKQQNEEDKYEMELKNKGMTEETIEYEMTNWRNHTSKRYHKENSFDFKIENIGIYTNEKLMQLACDIIINKIKKVIQDVKTTKIPIKSENIALENSFDITLKNEDYTLGKVLEYILHYKYYQDLNHLTYVGFIKPHPHDKDSLIRIAFKKQEVSKNDVYTTLLDTCDIAINIFETIKNDFK